MKNKSIWETDIKLNHTKSKQLNSINTDILIIGGGITGISTAYFLKDKNYQITLIDKGKIGHGVTSKTTAKINYLQGTIYQELEKSFNKNTSKLYLDSQKEAIQLITNIIKKEKIDCDLEQCDAYIFTKEEKNKKKIDKEKELLESWNINCSTIDKLPILFPIKYGIKVKDTYTFHPLKYINGLVQTIQKNISIYENINALEIKKEDNTFLTTTNQGTIKSKYVIVACHYPFFIMPGWIPIKTYVKREYVNCSKYENNYHFTAISIDSILHSIRFYNDYIIYGSNQQRLTNKITYKDNYEKSNYDFKRLFSKEPEYIWMNQDLMTNDKLPLIGKANKKEPNLLIATSYNAWGMTNGTIAGKIISDLILHQENKYIDLFKPTRISTVGIQNSIINSIFYSKIYLQTTFKKNPVFYNDAVYVIKMNGTYYGVYYDLYGKKHIVKNKCPHMKCNLVFNDFEKTWDCPCHGSRFDIDGNVLEGPANYSISINNLTKKDKRECYSKDKEEP